MPCNPGEGEKTGWACELLLFVFLKQNKTRASLRVDEIYGTRAAICVNPTEVLSLPPGSVN